MSQHIPERPVDRLPRRRSERVQCAVGWLILLFFMTQPGRTTPTPT